jgi:hypothetical protein
MASVAADGTQGNSSSVRPSTSGDGRFVSFDSAASNLVPGDTNGIGDVFVHQQSLTIPRVHVVYPCVGVIDLRAAPHQFPRACPTRGQPAARRSFGTTLSSDQGRLETVPSP